VHIDGIPRLVTIDDNIPFFESSKQPAFINTGSDSIWALLLEKAWAKVCGSYEKAHSMTVYDFFSLVSPYSVKGLLHSKFATDQKTFFWNYLTVNKSTFLIHKICPQIYIFIIGRFQ
jgi:hypothetical protein